MDFKLNFTIPQLSEKISYRDKIMLLGSCFSENIGDLMEEAKFNCLQNPHGILYNPLNIADSIQECINGKKYTETDLFYANEQWNSFHHHSRFSDPDKEKCLSNINNKIETAHHFLKESKWLFITFGSAFIYRNNSEQKFVANCHKIPQKEFTKELVSVQQIVTVYEELIDSLMTINPTVRLIFTVSPVRYIRDGVAENNLSKSILVQAIHQLVNERKTADYFPAYEIVMDELRDYRFFKTDMVHPNDQAIDYVFERFREFAIDDESLNIFSQIIEIKSAMSHRPFNENSDKHKAFRASYLEKTVNLKQRFAFLELTEELNYFRGK